MAKRGPSQFEKAADGSMSLVEHFVELRSRLMKACIAILVGAVLGYLVAPHVQAFMIAPYCELYSQKTGATCQFNANSVLDPFLLNLKISLYIGLVVAAPIWLFQLWRFVAPGLLKRERRYAYSFAGVAAPLFAAGFVLGFYLVTRSLKFFLSVNGDQTTLSVNLDGYFSFVTGVMLLFGLGFQLPVVVLMLNFAGVVSAKRLLGWWRVAVFLMFLFAAIVTPTPDPFNMTILAACMAVLYFAAVGVAFLNDRRKARAGGLYAGVGDDEVSPIEPVSPVDAPTWGVHGSGTGGSGTGGTGTGHGTSDDS